MNIGIIGLGKRGKQLYKCLMEADKKYKVNVACFYDENSELCQQISAKKNIDAYITSNQEEFWSFEYDLVIIASSNWTHKDFILRAMEKNLNIFCEKPIVTTIDHYQKIMDTKKQLGFDKLFATGFCLRYSPIFQKLKEIVGQIGKIGVVNATDVINHTHGAHVFVCWRRYNHLSGGHSVEKVVHSLDILNWCIGSRPIKVFAFGGNDYWTPENRPLVEDRLMKLDSNVYNNWKDHENLNPFMADKTTCDNIVSSIQYENGAKLNLTMLTYAPNARRTMVFYGLHGSVEFIWEMGVATITLIKDGIGTHGAFKRPCDIQKWQFGNQGVHGGGDHRIVDGLLEAVKKKTNMIPSINEAFYSNNTCIAVTKSLKSGLPEKVIY